MYLNKLFNHIFYLFICKVEFLNNIKFALSGLVKPPLPHYAGCFEHNYNDEGKLLKLTIEICLVMCNKSPYFTMKVILTLQIMLHSIKQTD